MGAHMAVEAGDGNQVDGIHVHSWRLVLSVCTVVGVNHSGLGWRFALMQLQRPGPVARADPC